MGAALVRPSLEIGRHSGDFQGWASDAVVSEPGRIVLRWSFSYRGASGLVWQLSGQRLPDGPGLDDPVVRGSLRASGYIPWPDPAPTEGVFEVDLSEQIRWPATGTDEHEYFLRVMAVANQAGGGRVPFGAPSAPVRVELTRKP